MLVEMVVGVGLLWLLLGLLHRALNDDPFQPPTPRFWETEAGKRRREESLRRQLEWNEMWRKRQAEQIRASIREAEVAREARRARIRALFAPPQPPAVTAPRRRSFAGPDDRI